MDHNNSSIHNLIDRFYNNNDPTTVFTDINSCDYFISRCHYSKLKLLHLNIRSIKKNFSDLCVMLQNFSTTFDVIALTETWLNNCLDFEISGYKKFIIP